MAKRALVALLMATTLSCVSAACSPVTSVINTQVKVDPGQSGTTGTNCYFPFTYSGTNSDCIGPYCLSASYCNYWCATSCNYVTDGLWNFCKYRLSDLTAPNCSGLSTAAVSTEPQLLYGGSGTGTSCVFPFKYNGVCYYDCIVTTTGGDPWCSTTDVVNLVNSNYKYCQYTVAGKNDPSCTNIASSTPTYLPRQNGTYAVNGLVQTDPQGNCTFPFYYNGKCYDDCTTTGAPTWFLPWCSTQQYYLPNKKMRFCPYYAKYQTYTGLSLSWGFYRIYLTEGCTTGGPFCNYTLAKATASVPAGSYGSPRIMLDLANADVFEVMPQGNGYFILRLPLPCSTNFLTVTTDAADVVYDFVSVEREFWNILPGTTAGAYTIRSTWNGTAGQYITRNLVSGYQVGSINSATASEWRFDKLSAVELASLSLPCENPTNLSSLNVNGNWCAWSSYTVSGSTGTRTRTCNCPAPSGTGVTCSGSSTDSGTVVNGTWCAWSAYTVTGAYGTRTRACNCSAPAYGGTCSGSSNDTGLAVNATWCAWSSYTVFGAYATRTRNCSCPVDAYGGSSICPGISNDTGLTVNGSWCAWSSFTVNGASGTRSRSCNCSAPDYAGLSCPGISNDTGLVVNGTWCAWSAFTVTGSYATRLRVCNCPVSDYGGSCQGGVSNDTGAVTNGVWCAWGAFTVVAGVGTRSRNCSCPDPAYTGSVCSGSSSDVLTQVNGSWCAWSSLASGYGVVTRTRLCNCSAPNAIGINCTGVDYEEYPCNVSSCQTTTPAAVNGGWCSWGSWVAGNMNSGKMSRSRVCGCPAASGSGAACSGTTGETSTCTIDGCMVYYAVPAESGTTGVSFTSSDTFNRLVIWASVVGGSILITAIVGLAMMLRYITTAGAV